MPETSVQNSVSSVLGGSLVSGILNAGVRYTSMDAVLEGLPTSLAGS